MTRGVRACGLRRGSDQSVPGGSVAATSGTAVLRPCCNLIRRLAELRPRSVRDAAHLDGLDAPVQQLPGVVLDLDEDGVLHQAPLLVRALGELPEALCVLVHPPVPLLRDLPLQSARNQLGEIALVPRLLHLDPRRLPRLLNVVAHLQAWHGSCAVQAVLGAGARASSHLCYPCPRTSSALGIGWMSLRPLSVVAGTSMEKRNMKGTWSSLMRTTRAILLAEQSRRVGGGSSREESSPWTHTGASLWTYTNTGVPTSGFPWRLRFPYFCHVLPSAYPVTAAVLRGSHLPLVLPAVHVQLRSGYPRLYSGKQDLSSHKPFLFTRCDTGEQ